MCKKVWSGISIIQETAEEKNKLTKYYKHHSLHSTNWRLFVLSEFYNQNHSIDMYAILERKNTTKQKKL